MRLLSFLLVFYIHETISGSAFNQAMQLNHLRAKRDDSMGDGLLNEDDLPEDDVLEYGAGQDDLSEAEKEAKEREALYSSDLFEGDIANPEFSKEFLEGLIKAKEEEEALEGTGMQANGIKDPYFRWLKVGNVVEIPFVLGDRFSAQQRSNIHKAIDHIRQNTCIRFVQKQSSHSDYIVIRNSKNVCYSSVGRIRGPQEMMLGRDCLHGFGIPVHEMMHAIGFFHEMSRADRDDYVDIIWSNIEERQKHNFDKYDLNYITHLGTSYDYRSIMHYDNKAFGIDNKITIVPKQRGVQIGQRRGLSSNDIYKINKMYDCLGAGSSENKQASTNCLQYSDKDVGIYNQNLATQKGQLSECCSICRSTQGCRAYAWNDYEGGTCWLKSVTEPLTDKPGVHVGILRD